MADRNRAGLGTEYSSVRVEPGNYEIFDGDTILFKNGFTIAGKDRVHLHGVDAPELGQTFTSTEELVGYQPYIQVGSRHFHSPPVGSEIPAGELAKEHLDYMCRGGTRALRISNMFWDRFYTSDPNKRQTGNIYADVRAWRGPGSLVNLNFSMVGGGYARVHTYYSDEHLATENYARQRHRRMLNRRTGLWAFLKEDEEEWSPMAWRREQRQKEVLDDDESSETTDRLDPNESWINLSDEEYAKLSPERKAHVDRLRRELREQRERVAHEKVEDEREAREAAEVAAREAEGVIEEESDVESEGEGQSQGQSS